MAIGATGTAAQPVMNSGLGNIQSAVGTPNATGGAVPPGGVNGIAQRPAMMNTMGNIGSTIQGAAPPPPPPAPAPQHSGPPNFSQMSPQVTQALKSLPPGILQQLHTMGAIHPGLMQHLNGSTR